MVALLATNISELEEKTIENHESCAFEFMCLYHSVPCIFSLRSRFHEKIRPHISRVTYIIQ